MSGSDLLRLLGDGVAAGLRALAWDDADRRRPDPVDQHAAEVTELLGIRPQDLTAEQRVAVRFAVKGEPAPWEIDMEVRVSEEGLKARRLGRDYGRASRTISEQRGQLAVLRSRLHDSQQREITARQLADSVGRHPAGRGLGVDAAARSTIAAALGLGPQATTGAIVVAIRGLRETAEDPTVVEVDAEKVSFPVAAAVDMTRQLDEHEQRAEILRRDNERLRADIWRLAQELETERKGRAHLARSVEAFADGVPHGPTGRALRQLVATTSGPVGSGSVREETGPHARGPVSDDDPGLPLSAVFDNRDPQQDEARTIPEDGGEPQ